MGWCATYDAERRAFGQRFRSARYGMAMADATELVHKYLPDWTIRRTRGGSSTGSWCYRHRKLITLSRDDGLPVVLHEIAHGLTDHGHGLAFQLRLLELIETEMGDYWMRRLRAQLIKAKSKGHKTHAAARVQG